MNSILQCIFASAPLTKYFMRRTNTCFLLWLILLTTESLNTWVLILSLGCQSKTWFQHRMWWGCIGPAQEIESTYVWLVSKICTGAYTERILHHWLMLSLTNLTIITCHVLWLYLTSAVYISFLTKCQTTSVSGFLVYWTSNIAEIPCVISITTPSPRVDLIVSYMNTGFVGTFWLQSASFM